MGHKGDMESRYTTNKGRLSDEMIEDMRRVFQQSEQFLSTEEIQEKDKKELLLEMWREQAKLYGINPLKIKIEKQRENKTLDYDDEILAIKDAIVKSREEKYEGKLVSENELIPYVQQGGEIENENNNLNATYHPTEHDLSDIAEAKTNQTIAVQVDIGAGNVNEKSIDSNVVLKVENTTNDAVNMTVSASSQSGPKVILINLNSTTIDVGNVKYLHIMYDGQPIAPAASVADVLHPSSSGQPHFAILVTQSGAQILISIPHFSTHTITITSLSKVIPSVPEFGPLTGIVLILAIINVVIISRKVKFHLS